MDKYLRAGAVVEGIQYDPVAGDAYDTWLYKMRTWGCKANIYPYDPLDGPKLRIETAGGYKDACGGDYIIRYQDGTFDVCVANELEKHVEPKTEEMDFGAAIAAAKNGKRITRRGWNGKGMFVVYQKGYPDGIPCNKQTAEAYGYNEGDLFKCRPYLQMRCADGTHQMWLASQSDILENDWVVV